MDSDRNSNRFLGFRRAKSLPLMDRTSSLAMLLLLFIIADVSNASILRKHRFLISDPPKVNSDGSTSPAKDPPVASPPPPAKPDPKLVNDAMNKTEPAPPVKTPDPNLDPKVSDNSTKSGTVGTLTDIDGKNNKTQKNVPIPEDKPKENPTPDTEQKPKENPTPEKPKKNPTPDPEKKPKEDPTPDPEEKPKENPTPDPEKKPKEDPTPDPELKPKENPTPDPELKPKEKPTPDPELKPKENPKNPTPDPELKPEGGKEKTPEVEQTKINNDTVTNVPNVNEESCDGVIKTCRNSDMVACIKSSNEESTEADILVQNLRDSKLNGTISAEDTRVLEIPKHKYKKIKLNVGKSNKIVVKAGNGECVLQMDPFVSEGNFFIRFPSYVNGAYFLLVTVIIFGGMWACCLIRRRKQRTGGGVPYQELEMALPESASATDVVTAEGWDQGWDDDWDDNAVKSPVGHLAGSISANGLTARSLNKDGWENNWDD